MSNWITPKVTWLSRVTSGVVLATIEQTGIQGGQTAIPTDKANDVLLQIVNEIRGAIQTGNRSPLSATVGSVPPELVRYTLVLTVEALANSIPNLSFVIDKNFQDKVKAAQACLEELEKGLKTCTWPSDPISVDASGNPVGPQSGGRLHPEPWLGTEELRPEIVQPCVQVGQTVYSGNANPNGVQVANVGDFYEQYQTTGQLSQIWQKGGTSGTNTDWLPYVF